MFCTLSFAVQFSRTALSLLPFGFVRQDLYSTTFLSVCQEVFKTFFKKVFSLGRFRSLAYCPLLRRLVYYITYDAVCQVLFKTFFKVFSLRFSASLPHSISLVSLSIIALFSGVVNTFFEFFRYFVFSFSSLRTGLLLTSLYPL